MKVFDDLPLPGHLHQSARIHWLLTHWCNYSCDYCGVPVFFKKSATLGKQAHAFDYASPAEWLRAFSLFPEREIVLLMTGGEPFLDRHNFVPLLTGLLEDQRFHLRIDTNGTWDPGNFKHLETSRIYLAMSYHPLQTSFADFRARLHRIRDSGFQFTDVHVVLAPENLDASESAVTALERDGFPVSAIPMIPVGKYRDRTVRSSRELALIKEYSYPLSAYFHLVKPSTFGKPCFHPAFSYRLSFDGKIHVACAGVKQDIFSDGVPPLPHKAVACPFQQCEGCAEMIRAIPNVRQNPKPLTVFLPKEAQEDMLARRNRSRTGFSPEDEEIFEAIDNAIDLERDEAGNAFVPLESIGNVFGFIDKHGSSDVIVALNRGRLDVYGWAGSSRVGESMKVVNLFIDGKQVASTSVFYPRPEVAELFQRPDLLLTGWRAYFFLPNLARGDHRLTAEATTAGGIRGELPAFTVRIVD